MAHRTRLYRFRRFAIRFVSPVLRLVAAHLPYFALVRYRGRRTGRIYEIPLNVFRDRGEWVIVLTYGSDAEWVKNVLVAGEAEMTTRGRVVRLAKPTLIDVNALAFLPAPVRAFGRLVGVSEVVRLRDVAA